jgi:UPF0716 protein FxsA
MPRENIMWLMLLLIALPLVEIALFVVVGGSIGLWATLAWVVLTVILGVLILKRIARRGAISFERDVRSLGDLSSPVADRAMTILAAGLLILPGFFTDTVGLLLLLPPIRRLVVAFFSKRLASKVTMRQAGVTIDGSSTEVSAAPHGGRASQNSARELPPEVTRH